MLSPRSLVASLLTWLVFRRGHAAPAGRRSRGAARRRRAARRPRPSPVDPERDHIRGPADAPVTLVEYGDFECPYCGQAEPVVRELLADDDDLRYVWRHLPLTDVHPHAQLAAEAAEAAAAQGAFWEMHDLLLAHQDELQPADLMRLRRASSAWTSSGSHDDLQAARRRGPGRRRTSSPPTSAASPARRPSSSTAAATTAPTTSPP